MLWMFSLTIIAALGIAIVGWWFSAPGYSGSTSDHFNGSMFENLEDKGFIDVLKWSLNREEAIQIHKDVNAEVSFGVHFGTFPLADDGWENQ